MIELITYFTISCTLLAYMSWSNSNSIEIVYNDKRLSKLATFMWLFGALCVGFATYYFV